MTKSSHSIVCALSWRERATRGGRWMELMHCAGGRVKATPDGVDIAFSGAVNREEIEELIDLERACCAWMHFDLVPKDGGIVLRVGAGSQKGIRAIHQMVSKVSR